MTKSKSKKSKSTSITSYIRGGMYVGTLAVPGVSQWKNSGVPESALYGYAGMDMNGNFEWDRLQRYWKPLVIWSLVDFGLSKLGVWKKMGQLLKL